MPNRIIKESIRESDSIDMLSHAAECTWYRLITLVDDYGLFKANLRLVNRALYPLRDYDDSDVANWLNELAFAEMVGFYCGEDGKPYGMILNWEQYNKPRNSKPKHPQPTVDTEIYADWHTFASNCMQPQSNASNRSRSRNPSRDTSASKPSRKPVKQKTKMEPPSLADVVEYFKAKGYTAEAAERAYNYYAVADWKDSKGNQVKNWKQKMISVWFKPENEAPKEPEREEVDF